MSLGARVGETSLNVPAASLRKDPFSTTDEFRLIHAPRPLQSMDFSRYHFRNLENSNQKKSGESYLTSRWDDNRNASNLMGQTTSGGCHSALFTDSLFTKLGARQVENGINMVQPQKSAVLAAKSDFGCNPPLSAEQESGQKEKRMSSKKNTRECLLGLQLNKQLVQAAAPVTPVKTAPRGSGLSSHMRKSCGLKLGDRSQHNQENAAPTTTPAHSSQKDRRGALRNGSSEVRPQRALSSSKTKHKDLGSSEKPRKAGNNLIK